MISWVEIGMDIDIYNFLKLIYIGNEKLIIIANGKNL